MKPKSKIDSKLTNLDTEARLRHLDFETEARLWILRPRRDETFELRDQGETFQKSNSILLRGETAVSRTTSLISTLVIF